MNASAATSILSQVEQHLADALALIDQHEVGTVAAPHIDFGLNYVRDALTDLSSRSRERSAG